MSLNLSFNQIIKVCGVSDMCWFEVVLEWFVFKLFDFEVTTGDRAILTPCWHRILVVIKQWRNVFHGLEVVSDILNSELLVVLDRQVQQGKGVDEHAVRDVEVRYLLHFVVFGDAVWLWSVKERSVDV